MNAHRLVFLLPVLCISSACFRHAQPSPPAASDTPPPVKAAVSLPIAAPIPVPTPKSANSPAETDWPPGARAAGSASVVAPGYNSPEALNRALELRWSLADIKAFCIPERRHNPAYQNLVADTPETWKGRLYAEQETGFDRISWYATVRDGKLDAYSLDVYRGNDFWLLEGGDVTTMVNTHPRTTPDPSAPRFIGHATARSGQSNPR
jgi:hypothetical protein